MKIHAYIINLQRCTARRQSILERLAAFPDIEPEIVEAVDARSAGPHALQKHAAAASTIFRDCLEHSLTDGEIACALSHLKCAERIVGGEDDVGLILEDDVLFAPEFGQIVSTAIEFLSEEVLPTAILFSARTWRYGKPKGRWRGPGKLFACSDGVGAYAYLVNKAGAKTLAEKSLPFSAPFDHWYIRRRSGLRLYTAVPHVASFAGNDDDSTLRAGRFEKWASAQEYRKTRSRLWWWWQRTFHRQHLVHAFHRIFANGQFEDRKW